MKKMTRKELARERFRTVEQKETVVPLPVIGEGAFHSFYRSLSQSTNKQQITQISMEKNGHHKLKTTTPNSN